MENASNYGYVDNCNEAKEMEKCLHKITEKEDARKSFG